jgi:uroporphyrinogen III methyltransferase/synthase
MATLLRAGKRVVVLVRGDARDDALRSAIDDKRGAAELEVVPGVSDAWPRPASGCQRPLFGRRVLVVRPEAQAERMADEVLARGGLPLIFPLVRLLDPPDLEPARRAVGSLARYDCLVFTSQNAVDKFFSLLTESARDARALAGRVVAAIGPRTSEALRAHGVAADLVAESYVAESLARAVLERGVASVLVPRALVARETLPEMLRASGVEVDVVPVYRTEPLLDADKQRLISLLEQRQIDVIPFTASSTVSAFAEALGAAATDLVAGLTLAAIGLITERALRSHGLPVHVSSPEHTVSGMLDALEAHLCEQASAEA